MGAKEMFKKLGLEYYAMSYKNDQILDITYSNNDGTWLTISKNGIEYIENHNRKNLPLLTLKAINKQIEELGWDK